MKQKVIDGKRAVALLERAVYLPEYGSNWVDPNSDGTGCRNVYKDSDGKTRMCIAAKALHLEGVPIKLLADKTINIMQVDTTVELPAIKERVTLTDEALKVLLTAQRAQDRAKSWGKALQAASQELHQQQQSASMD